MLTSVIVGSAVPCILAALGGDPPSAPVAVAPSNAITSPYVAPAFALNVERFAELAWTRAEGSDEGYAFRLSAFHEDIELEAVRRDVIRAKFKSKIAIKLDEIDLETDRSRSGIEARFGNEALGVGVAAFSEQFEMLDDFDLVGVRISFDGMPQVAQWGNAKFILDYGANYSYSRGEGDVKFLDKSAGKLFDVESDINYYNYQLHAGVGIDVADMKITVGALFDVMSGLIDHGFDNDMEFEAGNYGGYVGLAYRPDELPVFASAKAFAGEHRGFAVELGLRF